MLQVDGKVASNNKNRSGPILGAIDYEPTAAYGLALVHFDASQPENGSF